jgi:hypothetical protein
VYVNSVGRGRWGEGWVLSETNHLANFTAVARVLEYFQVVPTYLENLRTRVLKINVSVDSATGIFRISVLLQTNA